MSNKKFRYFKSKATGDAAVALDKMTINNGKIRFYSSYDPTIYEESNFSYAPVTASSSSQMTDHSHIYVYTGTTSGSLTNGNWYYWDASLSTPAWVSGGAYMSAVDISSTKVSKPLSNGSPTNGTNGQLLKTNGDGTTNWIDSYDDDIEDLKSALSNDEDGMYKFTTMYVSATASGWRLNPDNGFSYSASGYQLVKYSVTAGTTVKVISDDYWQFNAGAGVPSSGTTARVGKTYGSGTFIFKVPATATYIVLSTTTNGSVSVYSAENKGNLFDYSVKDASFYTWALGTINDDTGADVSSTSRIRSEYIYAPAGTKVHLSDQAYEHVVMLYNLDYTKNSYIQNTWTKNDVTINTTGYIRIVIRKASNATISSDEISTIASGEYVITNNSTVMNILKKADVNNIVCFWNQNIGGIYKEGNSIKTHQNGFGIQVNGTRYYIASRDQTTEYAFTITSDMLMQPYFLVLDLSKLTYVDARNNPNVVLSIISIYDLDISYTKNLVPIAIYYKGYWDFIGEFTYFNCDAHKTNVAVSTVFTENQLSAHMGGNTGSPNTISNFETAIANGYKILECDVQFTSDSVAVLSHEDTISSGGQTYTIAEETYSTLIAIEPNLATLEELLILCKTNNVVGELDFTKTYTSSQQTIVNNLIMQTGTVNRVFVTTYASVCRSLLAINPDLLLCVSGITSTSDTDNITDIIHDARVCICSVKDTDATSTLVKYIHTKGAMAKVWTVNTLSTVQDFFEIGFDYVITDSVKPSDLQGHFK